MTFDFDAHFENIKDNAEALLIGKAGVPGALNIMFVFRHPSDN